MRRITMFLCLNLWAGLVVCAHAQQSGEKPVESRPLTVLTSATMTIQSLPSSMFSVPVCDESGNLYALFGSEVPRVPLVRITPKGEVLKLAMQSASDLNLRGASSFAVAPDGEVYWLAWDNGAYYVLRFKKDGSYIGNIKIDKKYGPRYAIPYKSGDLLVVGRRPEPNPLRPDEKISVPFTAIFGPDGALKKELVLKDDQTIRTALELGDNQYVSPVASTSNRPVDLGYVRTGKDGNVYLMRYTSPAIIYAISPAGEVVRRLVVEPPSPGQMPTQMLLSEQQIAVLFWNENKDDTVIKVVSATTGGDVATYQAGEVGPGLACFESPSQFTYLGGQKGLLAISKGEPR